MQGSEEEVVHIMVSVPCGKDVRPTGVDIALGQPILAEGERLGPAEIGLLSAVGVTTVSVCALPRVAVLSTGNEVSCVAAMHGFSWCYHPGCRPCQRVEGGSDIR